MAQYHSHFEIDFWEKPYFGSHLVMLTSSAIVCVCVAGTLAEWVIVSVFSLNQSRVVTEALSAAAGNGLLGISYKTSEIQRK